MDSKIIYKEYKTTGKFSFCKIISGKTPIEKDIWDNFLEESKPIKTEAHNVIRYLDYDRSVEFKFDLIDYLESCLSLQNHSKYKVVLTELIENIRSINKKRTFDLDKIIQADLNSDINNRIYNVIEWDLKTSKNWKRKLNDHLKKQNTESLMISDVLKKEIEYVENIYANYIKINSLLIKSKFNQNYIENFRIDFENYSNNIFYELKEIEKLCVELSSKLDETDKEKWDNTRSFFLKVINEFLKNLKVTYNNDFKRTNYYPYLGKSIELLNSINSDIFHKTDILNEIPLDLRKHNKLDGTAKIALHILVRDLDNNKNGTKTYLNKVYRFIKHNLKKQKQAVLFDVNYDEYKSLLKSSYDLDSSKRVDGKIIDTDKKKFNNILSESDDFS
jgi:hypothetical protein